MLNTTAALIHPAGRCGNRRGFPVVESIVEHTNLFHFLNLFYYGKKSI
nr:MAG TPA: hypothetical protein [Microviridae sp.]